MPMQWNPRRLRSSQVAGDCIRVTIVVIMAKAINAGRHAPAVELTFWNWPVEASDASSVARCSSH